MNESVKRKTGVYGLTGMLYMQVVVSVLLGNIAAEFPDASLYKVQLVFSITSITCMIGSLITGKLVEIIPKKILTLIALVMLLVSGVGPLFLHSSIDAFIVFSAFVGLAVGLLQTLADSYSLQLFKGAERDKVIGVKQSILAVAGTVFIYVAGMIAATNYLNGFYVYLAAIPVILIVIFCIPKDKKIAEELEVEAPVEAASTEKVRVLNPAMIILLILMLFFAALQGAFMQNISLVVINSAIGDASVAGTSTSLYIAGGILVGFVLSKYMKIAKRFAFPICFFLSGLALLLPVIALNTVTVYLCGALCGFSCTLYYGMCLMEVPKIVPAKGITMACAYVSMVFALGSFVSPYIVNPISGWLTSGTDIERLMVAGIGTLVFGVIAFFANYDKYKIAE